MKANRLVVAASSCLAASTAKSNGCTCGRSIAGSGSSLGFEVWLAIPFTPSANISVKKLQVSVGYIVSADPNFVLSLYTDSGGVPGTAIKSFPKVAANAFGACCTLVTASDAAGIPVTSGTQYWVVVKTNDSKHPTFFGAWAFNSTDMRGHTIASWCKSTGTQCGSNNGKWVSFTGALQPAYAVKGS